VPLEAFTTKRWMIQLRRVPLTYEPGPVGQRQEGHKALVFVCLKIANEAATNKIAKATARIG
jgi:hypothetical protein